MTFAATILTLYPERSHGSLSASETAPPNDFPWVEFEAIAIVPDLLAFFGIALIAASLAVALRSYRANGAKLALTVPLAASAVVAIILLSYLAHRPDRSGFYRPIPVEHNSPE